MWTRNRQREFEAAAMGYSRGRIWDHVVNVGLIIYWLFGVVDGMIMMPWTMAGLVDGHAGIGVQVFRFGSFVSFGSPMAMAIP